MASDATNKDAALDTEAQTDAQAADENSSDIYVGRWRGLVSTTNWEKGRVISEWRQALVKEGASPSDYSDESWSRTVGNITPQHVGRLRRVHEKFGEARNDYDGLFWSHFHATIDWDDAEMWLEGVVQNGWSVSQMRRQRWETMGGNKADEPQDADIVSTEQDEDINLEESAALTDTVDTRIETIEGLNKEDLPQEKVKADGRGDVATMDSASAESDSLAEDADAEPTEPVVPFRPFAELPELPDDLADAFDEMKLAILRHKTNEWEEISLDDVLLSIESLKQLAAAPSMS